MYIMSTNQYVDLEFKSRIPASVIASERYFNCENFFADINHKKGKLFLKNILSKKK